MKGYYIYRNPERSAEQNKAVTQASFSRNYPGALQATLEIFGTPNFHLTQKIAVFIFKPQQDSINDMFSMSADTVHWISGFFRIVKIYESIKAGKYTTTLELVSDGRGRVAPDVVPTQKST